MLEGLLLIVGWFAGRYVIVRRLCVAYRVPTVERGTLLCFAGVSDARTVAYGQ